jgi:hypothetical protein
MQLPRKQFQQNGCSTFYFSYKFRPPEVDLALNGWYIPIVSHAKSLGVNFNKRIALRPHIPVIQA